MGAFHTLYESFKSLTANPMAALAFVLLFVFFLPLSQLGTTFVSAGSIYADYNLTTSTQLQLLLLAATVAVFLLLYSVLTTVVVFAVKRDLSKVSLAKYISSGIPRFALKYAAFLLVFTAVITACASALLSLSVPAYAVGMLVFLASLPFIFLPQALVVEESGFWNSLASNTEFISKNPLALLYVIVLGTAFALILPGIDLAFDYLFGIGRFAAVLVATVFMVPFIEILKTHLYMTTKFTLVTASLTLKKAHSLGG